MTKSQGVTLEYFTAGENVTPIPLIQHQNLRSAKRTTVTGEPAELRAGWMVGSSMDPKALATSRLRWMWSLGVTAAAQTSELLVGLTVVPVCGAAMSSTTR